MFPEELEIDPDELSIALCYLQSFEPAGRRRARRVRVPGAAAEGAAGDDSVPRGRRSRSSTEHLPLLAARDFTKLKRMPALPTTPACARCAS